MSAARGGGTMSAVGVGTGLTTALLRAEGLVRHFGEERAVDGVDLSVEAGQIHALVGLNGAGKTTLMRLLLGMLEPDAGRALLRDDASPPGRRAAAPSPAVPAGQLGSGDPSVDVRRARPAAWATVGHLVEAPFGYAELTVTETVRVAARLRGMTRDAAATEADRVIDALALGHWAARRAGTLSLGNRQRLGLACAVVHRPRVLVLDEPANGLDPAGVVLVREHLTGLAAGGAGILVSSHHLDEMARIAHRITVLHRGRAVGVLAPDGADLERAFFAMVYAADEESR